MFRLLDLSIVACYQRYMGLFDFLRSPSDGGEQDATAADTGASVDAGSDTADAEETETSSTGVRTRDKGAVDPEIQIASEGTPHTPRGIHDVVHDEVRDRHVVVEEITTAEEGPIGARHLSLTDVGRRLSDTWLREELGDLLEGSDPERAVALETAFLTNSLERRLVVDRTRPGNLRVDETIEGPDFTIDDVEVHSPGGDQ